MKRKSKSFISSFFTMSLLLCLAVLLFGGIWYLVNYIKLGANGFYLQYGNTTVTSKVDDLDLPCDRYVIFTGKTAKTDKNTAKDFKVSIVPNATAENNFNFKVDCNAYDYSGERDLTVGFDVKVYGEYLALYLPSDLTMQSILQAVYKGYTVTDVPDIAIYEKDWFSILVTSYDGTKLTIGFH